MFCEPYSYYTALLLSQNGTRSNLRASNFLKFPGGACPQTPLVLHAYAYIHAHIYVTPFLKILATGLEFLAIIMILPDELKIVYGSNSLRIVHWING